MQAVSHRQGRFIVSRVSQGLGLGVQTLSISKATPLIHYHFWVICPQPLRRLHVGVPGPNLEGTSGQARAVGRGGQGRVRGRVCRRGKSN